MLSQDLHGQPVEGPPAPTSSQISSISEEEVELKRRSYIRNAIPDGIQDLLNGHMTEIRAGIQQSAQDTAQANAELVQQLMAAVRDR